MKQLRISPELALPLEAVTETFGILAVKRAGKSNAAVVMAEEMFDAGLPWVAIDPKGDWWGIRSSADGNGPGLPILVLGGLHGDVPLEAAGGHLVADLVVDQRLTCVLDVSEMSRADQRRFLTDFAERLYKRNREPLHVFCEEADEYIPQRVMADSARLVGAFETLVKRGGFRGLGITLVTQRSASLNKDVLTQVQTLFAMRTTSPQDRKAILGWVVQHALGEQMVDELPALESGEAWLFSPSWLRKLEKVRFRRRRTFDSGATPTVGVKARPPVALAEVDIEALRIRMATTIEKAKAEDPKALKGRIRELEQQLADQRRDHDQQVSRMQKELLAKVTTLEVPVYPAAVRDWLMETGEWAEKLAVSLKKAGKFKVTEEDRRAARVTAEELMPAPKTGATSAPTVAAKPATAPQPSNGAFHPSGSQQRILDSLAWLQSVGMSPATKPQLALLAEQRPTSSGYRNNLSMLRTAGLVDYPAGGMVALTEAGDAAAAMPEVPPTSEALQAWLYGRLSGSQARILQELVRAYPEPLAKPELAERAGQQATSSGYRNNLSTLRTFGLIDYPTGGQAVALPVLFLEGR